MDSQVFLQSFIAVLSPGAVEAEEAEAEAEADMEAAAELEVDAEVHFIKT